MRVQSWLVVPLCSSLGLQVVKGRRLGHCTQPQAERAHLLERAASFTLVAVYAGRGDVYPGACAAHAFWDDVIQSELICTKVLLAAVAASVVVSKKNVSSRQYGLGAMHGRVVLERNDARQGHRHRDASQNQVLVDVDHVGAPRVDDAERVLPIEQAQRHC